MNESKYLAAPSDGQDILHILESSSAKGEIELIYTRRPDAYKSYMKESGEARVFIAKNGARAIGTCAEIIREVYIGGEICRAAYLCGLKKDAEYDGGVGFGARLIRDLQRDDIGFYYCSVVADNADARRMFEKNRRIISMKPMMGYKTYILSPKVRIRAPKHSLIFRKANGADTARLLEFLNTEGRKKDMFPVIHSIDDFHGLTIEDFYLLMDGETIMAASALWNQSAYKQYVVKRYGKMMKLARVLNPILSSIGYIRLPRKNQALNFPMLSFFLCQNESEEYDRIFFDEIRKEIAREYGMFVIGLPEGHFASKMMDKLPSISFETKLYEIRFPWSEQTYQSIDARNTFFECGLL